METFEDYFACGMSAAEAFHHHESTMMNDSSTKFKSRSIPNNRIKTPSVG
jgi:hypothetical protein